MKVGIVGASGYTGVELLRLCAGHPDLEVALVTANINAGQRLADHTPSLAGAYPELFFERLDVDDPALLDGLDVVFFALPHGESQRVVPALQGRVGTVVDLAADFRLADPALYPAWYGAPHAAPELLGRFAYGIPELFRAALVGADRVAAAGCYPTAAARNRWPGSPGPSVRGGA
jgi:N-acetyl-gamma-glutamyl-phosphate reductase